MTIENPPELHELREPPQRGTRPESAFTEAANNWTADQLPFRDSLVDLADWMKFVGDLTQENAESAESYKNAAQAAAAAAEGARDMAQASANFIGRWADQTGSVAVPASVHHSGAYWALLEDLTDIALEEPGNSTSWSHIFMGGDGLPYGPGPQALQAGDMQAGYFGEVAAGELFSGDELAFILGVTEGVSQHSDAGWLKFAFQGDIIYVAKRPFRHSISWDHLYERGIVYGTDDEGVAPRGTPTNQLTKVDKGPYSFICRLLTGANADPFDDSDPLYREDGMCALNLGEGSEWNELIYRVHTDVPDCPDTIGMTEDRHGGAQDGSNWADYTDSELVIGGGNGRFTWCQEAEGSTGSSRRLVRGFTGVADFFRSSASGSDSARGWRPALILVPNS